MAAAYLTVPPAGVLLVFVTTLGFAALNELLRKNLSSQRIVASVLACYFLTGITAAGTLLAGLPPPAFWVVSAVLPAWQAYRLLDRGDLEQASRMLHVAFGVFASVLALALWLPVLLAFR